MNLGRGKNLRIINPRGDVALLGKIVPYQGEPVLHEWVKEEYKLRLTDTYGLNRALIAFLQDLSIKHVFLYLPAAKVTRHTTMEWIEAAGVPGYPHAFGSNLNIPKAVWETITGRITVNWVDDKKESDFITVPWLAPVPDLSLPEPIKQQLLV